MKNNKKRAWIITVDMGYGHQRASYPLRHLSPTGKVIAANNYAGIPKKDKAYWGSSRKFYEFVSRLTALPLIGQKIFDLYDKLQSIPPFYPKRDLSKPTIQISQMYRLIRKGWGKHLVDYLNNKNSDIPLITTFFVPAFMAEEHKFKNDIYCILTDADISRSWISLAPQKSKIKYLAPCRRVAERLRLYGVPEENIHLTGFPLPEENLGGSQLRILKEDLAKRIINLDPERRYRQKYCGTLKQFLDGYYHPHMKQSHPLTLTFAVGGAGAQRDIATDILFSLKSKILKKQINLNLVAGSRNDVYIFFSKLIKRDHLKERLGKNLQIIFDIDKETYFKKFNDALRTTDVLWTKPSELSFYTALGLPIIMAPIIGSQEEFNREWLTKVGGGLIQRNPKYTHEWFFDWVNSGWLAEAAMSGFLDGRQFGVNNIEQVVFEGVKEPARNYQLL